MIRNTTKYEKLATYEDIASLMSAIKSIRKFFGMTAQTFALMCDVQAPTYRVLEKEGKGNVVTIYKVLTYLANKLSIDVSYLLVNHSYPELLYNQTHLEIKKQLKLNKPNKQQRMDDKELSNLII
jgi:hypothetical protein